MGQLTDTGLASLHRTGRFLKRVYLDRLGLVPADGSAGVYVRSTDYTRVLQSTFALLGGMFTGSTSSGGEVDGEFLTRHAIYARSDNRETLHGNVGCYNFLRIHFGRSVAQACQDTAWLGAVYRQTAALPSIGQQAKAMMDRSAFGSNFHPVFDELVALAAHGEDLPVGLTRDHLRLLGAAAHHQWYAPGTSASGQRLGYGLLLAELVATMDQAARGDFAARMGPQTTHDVRLAPGGPQTDPPKPLIPRLALYGAHDITLAPLAHIMGHPASSDWMPFASTLALELLRDPAAAGSGAGAAADLPRPPTVSAPPPPAHFVRILFNGQPIAVPTCAAYGKHHPALGPSVCTLDAFYEHIAHIIPAPGALDAECGTPPV
ncbi:hypothetical protein H4R19_001790 [Coemansia spiralis]|nr:hypothetical protein H4R19_001790 [Coemansia spiralis]